MPTFGLRQRKINTLHAFWRRVAEDGLGWIEGRGLAAIDGEVVDPANLEDQTREPVRIPVKVISDSGLNVISDSGQSDHRSERSDAGVGL